MKSVGVPRTSPDAIPLWTSRSMCSRTRALARSTSNAGTSSSSSAAYRRGRDPRERVLMMKEQLVHLPEPALKGGGLHGGGCGEGMRMDLGQREMPEGKSHPVAQPALQAPDLPKRLSRVCRGSGSGRGGPGCRRGRARLRRPLAPARGCARAPRLAGTTEIPNWRAVLPFPAAIDTKLRHSSASCSYEIGTPRGPKGGIYLAAPLKPGVAPYYMPFALQGGVPSVASWARGRA
jgi:hypothetical protein